MIQSLQTVENLLSNKIHITIPLLFFFLFDWFWL